MWEERFRKLESRIYGKDLPDDSPKPVTTFNDNGSGQGSYSQQNERTLKVFDVETSKAVKKLLLGHEAPVVVEEEVMLNSKGSKKFMSIVEEEIRPRTVPIKFNFWEEVPVLSSNLKSEFKLAIDSLDNIVAFGTIIQVDVEGTQ
ncbi:uncharacterized protein LOC121052645 [Rosa chinensis]|uniref:uncharacterized protein LOC121052644 n=1 Tax=Rosa chinensis TaxID=74649 RepID=UPI001AD8E22D|nr:uncharacterized protein LOC121052644 [Rosa chinensis]XP_040373950.1 uncharacterized protein LOC121052645 [Rosa chinensis]